MRKLTDSVLNTIERANLRQTITYWRWSMASLILGLVLVACSYAPASDESARIETGTTPSAARAVSVADTNVAGAKPSGNGQSQIDALDANAIVAAHEQVLTGIYETVVPSVVQIRTVQRTPQQGFFPNVPEQDPNDFFQHNGGSGFVWDNQGRIVTNHHVIDGADRVTVIFADHRELEAKVLGSDPDSDLAVLQVEVSGLNLQPVALGDSSAVRVGQLAVAIGNPFGQEFTITSGIISAVGRTIRSGNSQFSIPHVIQTDAPINPGNSGGPLLDRRGQVIGVNTQIISQSGANSGIGFAVPIDTAKQVIPVLIETGSYDYAWLGISGTTLSPDIAELMNLPRDTKGALVIDVAEGGPAAQGHLQGSDTTRSVEGIDYRLGGDIIVGINGNPIDDMDQLISYLIENTRPGDVVEIEVLREGGTHETLSVTLGERPGI